MNGTTEISGGYLTPGSVTSEWQICRVADFDGDGKPDIVFHHQKTGTLIVWFMDGTSRIAAGYLSPSGVSPDWQIRQ